MEQNNETYKSSLIKQIEKELEFATSTDVELNMLVEEIHKNLMKEVSNIASDDIIEIANDLLPKYNNNKIARSILFDYINKFNE